MKKDKKFLLELEQQLNSISKKKRDAIVLKYRNIIDEKIKEKKKIRDILKEIGIPIEVAQKEICEIKKNKKIDLSALKENVKKIGSKTKSGIKKAYKGITKDIQLKPKDKKEKMEEPKIKEKNINKEKISKKELKEIKIKPKKISKKELNKKIDEEDKLIKERIKKSLKENQQEELIIQEEKPNNKKKTNKLEENDIIQTSIEEYDNEIVEKIIEDNIIEEKVEVKENKLLKLKEKFKKKKSNEIIENKLEDNEEQILKEEKVKKKINKKQKEVIIEEDIFDKESNNQIEEICEITEIISNTPKYMSKKDKTKKIVFELLGVAIITIMLFIWMWISVLFLASLFAFLDGIKLYGISVALLGLDVLFFWITIMINRMIFKKKNVYKTNLIIVLTSVFVIALGITLFIHQTSKIEHESDVTLKYSMTTKYDTYKLPSKEEEKMYIFFNSNYNTQYMIKYDNNLDGKFKLEVKYYENYYDYNIKKSSNNLYVSLSVDPRDRISSYIDDFKENKIYNKNELSRYIVKITVSEKDYQRLVIKN